MACLYEKAFMAFGLGKIKTVDSYKEMCDLLEEPDQSKHPDLKKRQLEMWKLCFSWTMSKHKFTRIKLYSSEEYLYNILKKKYYNTAFYMLCALLNQFGKTSDKPFLLATKSELAIALGFYNEDFKAARFGKKTKLVEIENNTLQKYGSKYDYLKGYKEEIRNKKNDNDITSTTYKAFEDFSTHQNKNINNKIDSLLEEMEQMRIIYVQKERIGGFIDKNFIKHYNVELDKIYQKDGNFYYDITDEKTEQKTSLLVPYEERILTINELSKQLNIDGKAILDLGFLNFKELANSGKFNLKKFDDLVAPEYKKVLNALFIYDTYKIIFDPFFMSHSQEIFLKRNQDLFSLTSIQNSLENINAFSKDNNIENKKNRQSKETIDERFILGKKENSSKKEILENLQKTELYLNRAFNDSFIDIDISNFFPKNSNLKNLEEYQYATWSKLFSRSDKKHENTFSYENTCRLNALKANNTNINKNTINTSPNNCHQREILSEDKIDSPSNFMIPKEAIAEISGMNYLCNSADSLSYMIFLIDYLESKKKNKQKAELEKLIEPLL